MTIDQATNIIGRVLREYDVKIDASYGVDARTFTQLLSIEIFKESMKEVKRNEQGRQFNRPSIPATEAALAASAEG